MKTMYGNPSEFEAFHYLLSALQAVVPGFEGPPQVAGPEQLRRRLEAAGLEDVTVHTSEQERIEMRSGRQLWDWNMASNPIARMIASGLTDEQRSDVIEVLDGMLRERAGGNGGPTVLTAPLNIGIGTKP